ncbi:hypothetical protein MMC26_005973 [Xylographa opegraphella]|nr:hypothetical protein [Xylographa opegraphella]
MLGKRRRSGLVAPPKKRQKSSSAIEEITFDFGAREDYLSGFHKRKLQRIKHAQEEATKKEREDKITARKMLREGRKEDLEKHVEAVNALLRKADGQDDVISGDEDESNLGKWDGIAEETNIDHEAEYEDEDRHTTVTIEAVDVTKEGLQKAVADEGSENEIDDVLDIANGNVLDKYAEKGTPLKVKRVWTKERPGGPKKKKKKFRYESKAERKATRHKERSGNKAKAKARKD